MLSKVHTSCQFCIFAQHEKNTVTQTGCKLGLLENYEELGFEILDSYNEKGEFYVINNKNCFFKRDEKWAKKRSEQVDTSKYSDELWNLLLEENKIKYQAIVVSNDSFSDLEKTIKSIIDQTIKPSHLTVFLPVSTKLDKKEVRKMVSGLDVRWRITYLEEWVSIEKAMQQLMHLTKNQYPIYQFIEVPNTVNKWFMEYLNSRIVLDGYSLSFIEGPDFNIGNTLMHLILRGDFSECTKKIEDV